MDSPLSMILGAAAAQDLATHLDLHTVGELVRHYPRRYLERGELSDIAGLQLGEYATLVAQVESATHAADAPAARPDAGGGAARRPRRPAGRHLLQPVQAAQRAQAGGAGAVRRAGRGVPREAAAHPPPVRAAAARRRGPPVPVDLPGHRQAAVLEDRQLRAPGARRARRPHRPAARRAAPGRAADRARPGAAPHPRAGDRRRPPGRAAPAGVGRGDGRAGGAGAAPAGHGVPARAGLPAEAGRPAGRVRRAAAVHPDRRPGRGGRARSRPISPRRTR